MSSLVKDKVNDVQWQQPVYKFFGCNKLHFLSSTKLMRFYIALSSSNKVLDFF